MKAVYLERPGKIVEKDIPKPTIRGGEVLVRIKSVGICGSDIEYYETGRIGEFKVEEPLILGHESAGVVAEVGDDVGDLEEGDRVALEPGVPCRKCKYCKTGSYNLCPDVTFMATPPDDGAFVEYFAHPEDFTYKLPESVSLDDGAMLEPFSVGLHAVRRARLEVADRVAILGAGTIGLMTLQAALVMGASEVMVTDVVDFRLEKAEQLGASRAINVEDESIDPSSSEFDRVLQTAGTAGTYRQALDLVRRGGRVVQVGFPSQEEVSIDPNALITRELDVLGSYRYMGLYPRAISLLGSGRVQMEPLISKHFDFDQVEEALKYPKENPDRCIKAMVNL